MSTSSITLYAELMLIPQSLKDQLCVMSLANSSMMWMNTCHMQAAQAMMANYSDKPRTMLSFPCGFDETDSMFLEFAEDLDNLTEGSSSVDDNLGREYIKVVKGDLERFVVLDFNDQAMNRFIEHQMLNTFKEFRGDCHRYFKKYSNPEKARVNPPHLLVGRDED
ncbi:CACTA en-spm transposon protein [Cucumis melo var. makuwa]|uniref:CACTA en-spm transposon protein n=1 Tax=Cucumis melo var. makuwa TaxID=1194695 RepID=A0A5D3DUW9_CUCMM|nr:CACTA en-spm transposon protein [Cucumis melo var. makuwa]TYK27577.1 CACTA en-spm transposon protein [Cucumis melo var. makuwa]